jgi:hypothetical protein
MLHFSMLRTLVGREYLVLGGQAKFRVEELYRVCLRFRTLVAPMRPLCTMWVNRLRVFDHFAAGVSALQAKSALCLIVEVA